MPYNRYLPESLSPDAALRIICLPCAGGSSAIYHRWRPLLPAHFGVLPIHLPGHDGRLAELPHTDLRRVAAEIADSLAPALERPFALVGHSLGAWVAFEVARELRRRGEPTPCALVAYASLAPHQPRSAPPMHTLGDAEFIAELIRRFDGIPPAVRENDELLQLLLPAIRADIQMIETYAYSDERPLEIDILALGGADDRAVSAADLAEWRRHTSGRFSTRLLPGGHFFLFSGGESGTDESAAAVRMLARQLGRYLTP